MEVKTPSIAAVNFIQSSEMVTGGVSTKTKMKEAKENENTKRIHGKSQEHWT